MNISEILKSIVMSDSQDERMGLAEQLTELIDQNPPSDGELEKALAEIERLNGEVKAGKQKYIDRFFGGNPDSESNGSEQESKTEEDKKAETISTDDIVKEMSK